MHTKNHKGLVGGKPLDEFLRTFFRVDNWYDGMTQRDEGVIKRGDFWSALARMPRGDHMLSTCAKTVPLAASSFSRPQDNGYAN